MTRGDGTGRTFSELFSACVVVVVAAADFMVAAAASALKVYTLIAE